MRVAEVWFHVAQGARRLPVPLTEPALAAAIWKGLRRAFPQVAAAVIMPDHLHLLAWSPDTKVPRLRLARVLSGLSRATRLGVALPAWEPVGTPVPVAGIQKVARQIRYIVLNPCRRHLVDDPLRWLWSTHRDVMGATADPWVTAQALARVLARDRQGFEAAHHAYVSGDPSTRVEGTPPPRPFGHGPDWDEPSLDRLIAAAAAAHRSVPAAILRRTPTRRLFLQLARELGRNDLGLLARLCGMAPQSVWQHRGRRDEKPLAAAWVCLGEERFIPQEWREKGRSDR